MDGCTYSYVDFTSLAGVGGELLNDRPALVFSSDGARVLWANVAGMELLGEARMAALLKRRFSDLNPLKAQMARLSRILPSETARIEILRIGNGLGLTTLAAACRRMNLEDGSRAVLVLGTESPAAGSLVARSERLVAAISAGDCLAAILGRNGKVLAASPGFDELLPAEPEIDQRIAEVQKSGAASVKAAIGRHGRQTGMARFEEAGRALLLVIVGPAATPVDTAATQRVFTDDDLTAIDESPVEMMLPLLDGDDEDEGEVLGGEISPHAEPPPPLSPPEPVVRFVWQTDVGGRFDLVSDALAETVGEGNGALVEQTWADIARILAIDPAGTIATALAAGSAFAVTLHWPDAARGDRVAVDLTGSPIRTANAVAGFRGFGTIRPGDRTPDERAERTALEPPSPTPETAANESPAAIATAEPPPAPDPTAPALPAIVAPPVPPPAAIETSAVASADDLDDAARQSIEEGHRSNRAAPSSNVVRLPGAPVRVLAEKLSGTERDAFRRIAEALGARQRAADAGAEGEATAPEPREVKAAAEVDTRLLDRLPIGIAIFRDRRTLFASRTLLDLLGYANNDAFLEAGGAEAIFPGREGLAGNIAEAGGKLAARRADGDTIPVNAWLHAVSFGGSTALMLSIEGARARSGDSDDELAVALARSEARAEELEAVLDTATDGVIVIDTRGKIGSMNHAAEALFGVNAGDYVGRYFTDLLADESQKAALDYLDGLAANGVASVLNDGREVIGRVPQGGLIPLFMTMGRVGSSDKFAAVLSDMTHWKNVEGELTAAKRAAEAANQQKSDFLAKISHEIRTPLNAIIGFSEVMMGERFGPIGNQRYRDYLHDIHVSGGHLMSLINDLLDLSKIEAGKLELSFEAVPVNAIIQECVALMQPQANRERIIIRTSLSSNVPNIVADPRSFRQILLNLLSNAIKFTRAGGQVIVSSTLEATGEVVVRIRDTGIGMSIKDLETAMKPFRQVSASREDRDQGTGLGLPLTKALVEANRATFAIESALNEGTLVKVTFPTTRVLAG